MASNARGATAWRCPECLINWPVGHQIFDACPQCGELTVPIRGPRPDFEDLDEALSEARKGKFELYYKCWDGNHEPERLLPTPEDRVKYPYRPELGNRIPYAERKLQKSSAS